MKWKARTSIQLLPVYNQRNCFAQRLKGSDGAFIYTCFSAPVAAFGAADIVDLLESVLFIGIYSEIQSLTKIKMAIIRISE